jgi:hypothetical protein
VPATSSARGRVSRDAGFRVADLDPHYLDDPKWRKLLRRLDGDVHTLNAAVVLHVALIARSWGSGERLAPDEALPYWSEPDPDLIRAMAEVGLVDADGRLPEATWLNWTRAAVQRQATRQFEGKVGGLVAHGLPRDEAIRRAEAELRMAAPPSVKPRPPSTPLDGGLPEPSVPSSPTVPSVPAAAAGSEEKRRRARSSATDGGARRTGRADAQAAAALMKKNRADPMAAIRATLGHLAVPELVAGRGTHVIASASLASSALARLRERGIADGGDTEEAERAIGELLGERPVAAVLAAITQASETAADLADVAAIAAALLAGTSPAQGAA